MNKFSKRTEEVNYWESMADSMVALLVCVLLVMSLLLLYVVRMPEEGMVDREEGDWVKEENFDGWDGGGDYSAGHLDDLLGNSYDREDDDGGRKEQEAGGGGQGIGDGHPYDYPNPGSGEKDSGKAAVLVEMVDGETGRSIKVEDVRFELYNRNAEKQVLCTYYPRKVEYDSFLTDEDGRFYFPEKLVLNDEYTLYNMTPVQGYDECDSVTFKLNNAYEWSEPFVAQARFFPAKNKFRIRILDDQTGDVIPVGSFDVVAGKDIVTRDGTVRYRAGDVVDHLEIGEEGLAESKELYLGEYTLVQESVPEFYAKVVENVPVEVKRKTGAVKPGAGADAGANDEIVPMTEISMERTSVRVSLADALYTDKVLSGVAFEVKEPSGVGRTFVTDESGCFVVTDLKKNTTYSLRQADSSDGYQLDNKEYSFKVSGDGLIDGKALGNVDILNRIVRIQIGVRDLIFKSQVSDMNVVLQDNEGNTVDSWNSSGMEHEVSGLEPGIYHVLISGSEDQGGVIQVEDKIEIQSFYFERMTLIDLICAAVLVVVVGGIVALFVLKVMLKSQEKEKNGTR